METDDGWIPPKRDTWLSTRPPEERQELARLGGKKAHELGRAHRYTTEEAKASGSKGGTKVSQDREHMRELGRRGGLAKRQKRRDGTK